MKPPRFFSMIELTRSETARARKISNALPAELLPQARLLLAGLERVRAYLGHPMLISSGYRCPELNLAVGGAPDSQHTRAEAVDFTCPDFGSPFEVCLALSDPKVMRILGIDQLIWEGEWVHMSFALEPRYAVLRMTGGRFIPGLT